MEKFNDVHGNLVRLSFVEQSFTQIPRHVLIICKFENQWLLTNHKERGWEFPGGKVEPGETLEEAAKREVLEETGGVVSSLISIGEYEVTNEKGPFVKKVFFAEIETIIHKEDYLETNGPVLVGNELLRDRMQSHYSFIMKDEVILKSLRYVNDIIKNEK